MRNDILTIPAIDHVAKVLLDEKPGEMNSWLRHYTKTPPDFENEAEKNEFEEILTRIHEKLQELNEPNFQKTIREKTHGTLDSRNRTWTVPSDSFNTSGECFHFAMTTIEKLCEEIANLTDEQIHNALLTIFSLGEICSLEEWRARDTEMGEKTSEAAINGLLEITRQKRRFAFRSNDYLVRWARHNVGHFYRQLSTGQVAG